jgi:hypothetical protein
MNSKEDERVAHCSVEEWEVGSGKHKSSSSSSRDRCIPRRFIPYNNVHLGARLGSGMVVGAEWQGGGVVGWQNGQGRRSWNQSRRVCATKGKDWVDDERE